MAGFDRPDCNFTTKQFIDMRTLGIILIGIGIIAFIYTGINYTTTEKVVDLGPLEINKEKKHSFNWPPIIGFILLLSGVVIIVTDKKTA
jgi:uncharacterized membrane protein YdcZ (DUF606 family)